MPEVALLTGWFGNIDSYSTNGFEALVAGPIDKVEAKTETQNGDVHLDTAWFGEER